MFFMSEIRVSRFAKNIKANLVFFARPVLLKCSKTSVKNYVALGCKPPDRLTARYRALPLPSGMESTNARSSVARCVVRWESPLSMEIVDKGVNIIFRQAAG